MKKFNDILFKWYSNHCVHLFDLFCRTWFDRKRRWLLMLNIGAIYYSSIRIRINQIQNQNKNHEYHNVYCRFRHIWNLSFAFLIWNIYYSSRKQREENYPDLTGMGEVDADMDGMGNFSRFPEDIKIERSRKLKKKNMKLHEVLRKVGLKLLRYTIRR